MILRPPRSTPLYSSAASDVYKRQGIHALVTGLAERGTNAVDEHDFTQSARHGGPSQRRTVTDWRVTVKTVMLPVSNIAGKPHLLGGGYGRRFEGRWGSL